MFSTEMRETAFFPMGKVFFQMTLSQHESINVEMMKLVGVQVYSITTMMETVISLWPMAIPTHRQIYRTRTRPTR